jgi:hypothetical protein
MTMRPASGSPRSGRAAPWPRPLIASGPSHWSAGEGGAASGAPQGGTAAASMDQRADCRSRLRPSPRSGEACKPTGPLPELVGCPARWALQRDRSAAITGQHHGLAQLGALPAKTQLTAAGAKHTYDCPALAHPKMPRPPPAGKRLDRMTGVNLLSETTSSCGARQGLLAPLRPGGPSSGAWRSRERSAAKSFGLY